MFTVNQKETIIVMAVICLIAATGCNKVPPAGEFPAKAEILVTLPDYCNTPDAMALMPDNSIILAVPNYNDTSAAAQIMKITADNKVEKFFTPPVHPDTKRAGPMGVCLAPSGDIYYADNHFSPETPNKSRVMRIEMKGGKAVKAHVVVEGLNVANAVAIRNGELYVSDTVMVPGTEPLVSGVFRFKIGSEGIKLTMPIEKDPHMIASITSKRVDIGYGADGLCFDPDGNLYIGNFADGTLHKLTFDAAGNVATNTIFLNDPRVKCADGLFYDKATKAIYVADMIQNAVHAVTLDKQITTIAINGDTDGADGSIDQPCEAIVRGNEVIISNMDWPFPGIVNTTFDKPYTISVVKLK